MKTNEPLAVSGDTFTTGRPIEGMAALFHCETTGHDYLVVAPTIEALEGIAVIRLGYEALRHESCQRVTVPNVMRP